MNWETVFVLAALGGVFAFGRDLFRAFRDRNKRLTQEESLAIREPIEMHSEILDQTKKAVTVQGAVMVELRLSIAEEQKRSTELATKLEAAEAQLARERTDKRDLYVLIGQLRAGKDVV